MSGIAVIMMMSPSMKNDKQTVHVKAVLGGVSR